MSATYLGELYERIKRANPMVPVLALGIYKAETAGDADGAHQRRERCLDNYGNDFVTQLDTCTLYFRLYGVPQA